MINYDAIDYQTIEKAELLVNEFGVLELRYHVSYPNTTNFQLGLSPLSDTLAIIPGYNFDFFGGETIELIKVKNDFELRSSGYRFQRITK